MSANKGVIVLGMMSGTSVDAIDTALVRFDEVDAQTLQMAVLAVGEYAMPSNVRRRVIALLPPGRGSVRAVCDLNFQIGEAFAAAALAAIEHAGLQVGDVDLIASHGQTVYHLVEGRRALSTLQIGQPAVIAERTGITTAADFRPRDVAAGGQGAPLVSYLDALFFADPDHTVAVQNIGGIGNATILPRGKGIDGAFAFDTGPGNSLIDAAVMRFSDGCMGYDVDGAWAAQGRVHQGLLDELLAHPYYRLQPPKSTGKELFGPAYVDAVLARARVLALPEQDVLATLTALTARSIAAAYRDFGGGVERVVLGGGGARNPTLLRMLAEALPGVAFSRTTDMGIPSDAKEAVAFALLGYQLAHHRPNTLPGCTGAAHAVSMGCLVPGNNFTALMAVCLAHGAQPTTRLRLDGGSKA